MANFNEYKNAAFRLEFDGRNRIFRESMALIYSTKNIDTLNGRYSDACEHLNWILRKKHEGFPITMNNNEKTMLAKLNEEKNVNILRIAELWQKDFDASKIKIKSKKAIENRAKKLSEILDKGLKSLVHSNNYDTIYAKIKSIREFRLKY